MTYVLTIMGLALVAWGSYHLGWNHATEMTAIQSKIDRLVKLAVYNAVRDTKQQAASPKPEIFTPVFLTPEEAAERDRWMRLHGDSGKARP